jgi:hypothetical protein
MESILLSFVSLALIIISAVTMTMTSFNSAAKLADSWKAMEAKSSIVQKTKIVSIPPESYSGGLLELTIVNEGQVSLSDFAQWDVFVEDIAGGVRYLTYSANYPSESNQWTIREIYISSNNPEVFDIGILSPGEQLVMELNPEPAVSPGNPIKITVATGAGVTTQCFVTGR